MSTAGNLVRNSHVAHGTLRSPQRIAAKRSSRSMYTATRRIPATLFASSHAQLGLNTPQGAVTTFRRCVATSSKKANISQKPKFTFRVNTSRRQPPYSTQIDSIAQTASTSHVPLFPHPYTFHIGASWAGKPAAADSMIKVPFPPDSIIGKWRDTTLSWPKSSGLKDAGEDFFFIQEVSVRS